MRSTDVSLSRQGRCRPDAKREQKVQGFRVLGLAFQVRASGLGFWVWGWQGAA